MFTTKLAMASAGLRTPVGLWPYNLNVSESPAGPHPKNVHFGQVPEGVLLLLGWDSLLQGISSHPNF